MEINRLGSLESLHGKEYIHLQFLLTFLVVKEVVFEVVAAIPEVSRSLVKEIRLEQVMYLSAASMVHERGIVHGKLFPWIESGLQFWFSKDGSQSLTSVLVFYCLCLFIFFRICHVL